MTKTIKTILLLIIIIFSFQVFIPTTLAQDEPPDSLDFTPQIPIPGSEFDGGTTTVGTSKVSTNEAGRKVTTMYSTLLPRYIKAIYNYGIGIAAFLALIMIVAGGIIWLTSAGASEKIGTAKSMITSSIIGLVLLLGTYTLLQIVSPALLSFKPIETEYIGVLQLGCCKFKDENDEIKAENMTDKDCTKEEGTFVKNASPNIEGNKCLKNGCCIYNNTTINWFKHFNPSIIDPTEDKWSCVKTNDDFCHNSKPSDWYELNSLGYKIEFIDKSCNQIEACSYSGAMACEGKGDGKRCSSIIGDCYCYDEIAVYGVGQMGDVCGNEPGSKCYIEDEEPKDWKRDLGGRNCGETDTGENLRCYYYNP